MRKLVRILLVALLLLISGGVLWLAGTESGLKWSWAQVQSRSGGAVAAEQVEGTLAGQMRLQGLVVDTDAAHVNIGRLTADWAPLALFWGTFKLDGVGAEDVQVRMPEPGPDQDETGDFRLPSLPLAVAIDGADVRDVLVQQAGEQPVRLERVTLTGRLGGEGLELEQLGVRSPDLQFRAKGQVGRQPGRPVDLAFEWLVQPEPLVQPVSGTGRVGGSVTAPVLDLAVSAPFRAEAEARVEWMDQPLAWSARLQLHEVRPAELNPDWPALRLGATMTGAGGAEDWRFSGSADAAGADMGRWQARWALDRDGPRWRLPELELASDSGSVLTASGQWRQAGGLTDIDQTDLAARWTALAWPPGAPAWSSPEGQLQASGRPDDYRVTVNAQLAGLPVGPSRWQLEGRGNLAGIELDTVHAALLEGEAEGTARIAWQPALSWTTRMALAGIDPGARWPEWEGRLAARLTSEGTLDGRGAEASASVENLSGTLRGYAVKGHASAELRNERVTLKGLRVSSGTAQFSASGSVGERWAIGWELSAPDLSHVVPRTSGSLSSEGELSGAFREPSIIAAAAGESLVWRGRRVAALNIEADVDLAGTRPWQIAASARGMALDTPAGLKELHVRARGRPDDHRIEVTSELRQGTADLTITGGLTEAAAWSGSVRDGRLRLQQIEWRQKSAAALVFSPRGARLEPWCWSHVPESELCLSGQTREDDWAGRLSVARFPLQQFSPWLPRRDFTVVGRLSGNAALSGTAGELKEIDVELQSTGGHLEYELDRESLRTDYRSVALTAKGTPQTGLNARAAVELDNGQYVRASTELPGWMPGMAMAPDQRLQGQAAIALNRTDWIGLLFPDVVITRGTLESRLTLAGALSDPQLSGQGRLRDARVVLPALGVSLESMQFTVRPAPGAAAQTTLQVTSGPGTLTAQGRFEVPQDGGRWRWDGTVSGERFEALRLPLGRALASPQLELGIAPGKVQIAGSVEVPEAKIELPELPEGTVQASPDVVVVDRGTEEPVPDWQVLTDVEVVFGKDVQVEGYGFSGRLGGSVRIVEKQPGTALAQGEVLILDGRYEAYGQKLTITEGRLLYASMPLANPGLDFRAVRELTDVLVGIRVGGRLQAPEVSLFSEPPMEESDQLAYLILGRPLSSASREEAGSVQSAATSLGLAGGGRIARQIGAQFGLDVVEVGAETDIAGAEQAALVLGKYLSPRLYIQYAVGIWEAVNTVRVRYELGRHWILEAASGPQSSTDLLYSIER